MTVLLPRRSHLSFIDHSYLQCIVCIALSKVWRSIFLNCLSHISPPSKCGINFFTTISKIIQNSCEWENFDYLLHLHDYIIQIKLFLNSYGSIFPHFTLRTQQSFIINTFISHACMSFLSWGSSVTFCSP
jgi:hypothetical protein